MNTTIKVTVHKWKPNFLDFSYVDEHGHVGQLNWELAQEKKLSWPQMQEIIQLHLNRVDIFKRMKRTKSIKKLVQLAAEVEQLENKLQEAWGFNVDRVYHTWWRKIPGCICNSVAIEEAFILKDIKDQFPTRFFHKNCPIHSTEEYKLYEKLIQD